MSDFVIGIPFCDPAAEAKRDWQINHYLAFARAYASLGDAVAEQVDYLLEGDYDDVMDDALALIRQRLYGFLPELDQAIEAAETRG